MTRGSEVWNRPNDALRWQPIVVDDSLRQRTLEVIQGIADDLTHSFLNGTLLAAQGANLPKGAAGFAIFYAYLAEMSSHDHVRQVGIEMLDAAVQSLNGNDRLPPGLHTGFGGISWVAAHLSGRLVEPDDENVFEDIDQCVLTLLQRPRWTFHYDLIAGLVGIGVYVLERLPHPTALECIRKVVEHTAELAHEEPEGVSWLTPPDLLSDWERREFHEESVRNLGVAHGFPGVVGLLGLCSGLAGTAGTVGDKARVLLQRAVPWLLTQPLGPESTAGFPTAIGSRRRLARARLAWCYGDPGIAGTLMVAARGAGIADWEASAIAIAKRATIRTYDESGVVDAGLCHGSAGLCQIFNRLFQHTGDPVFKAAALYWLDRTLQFWSGETGFGGFKAAMAKRVAGRVVLGEWELQDDPSFLTGAAGIGLALIATVSSVEPKWDRVLLLS